MPMSSFEASINSNITGDVAIVNYRRLLKEQGYVYIEDIPDGFDYLEFTQKFGSLIPHKYNGEYVFSIKVEPNLGERYPAFTTKDVEPHTEGYEYDHMPLHYQCLWCVHPPSCGGGHTLLADGYSFVNSLTDEEREYITKNKFDFVTPSNNVVKHPLYDVESCEQPIVRFNFSSIKLDTDPYLNDIANRFLQFFDKEKISIKWSKNALLIWDNLRMLHSRTQYQDQERHLKRVYLN